MSKCPKCGETLATHYNDTETFKRCIHCGYRTHSVEEKKTCNQCRHYHRNYCAERNSAVCSDSMTCSNLIKTVAEEEDREYLKAVEFREILATKKITKLRKQLDTATRAFKKISMEADTSTMDPDLTIETCRFYAQEALAEIKGE